MRAIADAGIWPGKLVTQIEPLTVFYEAEPEYHHYFARNPWSRLLSGRHSTEGGQIPKHYTDRLKREAAE